MTPAMTNLIATTAKKIHDDTHDCLFASSAVKRIERHLTIFADAVVAEVAPTPAPTPTPPANPAT